MRRIGSLRGWAKGTEASEGSAQTTGNARGVCWAEAAVCASFATEGRTRLVDNAQRKRETAQVAGWSSHGFGTKTIPFLCLSLLLGSEGEAGVGLPLGTLCSYLEDHLTGLDTPDLCQEESLSPCPCENVLVQRKASAWGPLTQGSLDSLILAGAGAGERGCCCFGEMSVAHESTWY